MLVRDSSGHVREWLKDRTAEMLVDDRGVDVGYLGTFREAVDHKRVQSVGVQHADVQEKVASAGDDEDADDFGQLSRPVAEAKTSRPA